MLDAIALEQPAVVFLAWPNNPTGNAFAREDLQAIIAASQGLVIIDEAYHVFAGQTMLSAVEQYPNVMVMRTLSKLGLAGLRLGTLIGAPGLIGELEKVRLPYNIGTLNQLSVTFICQHMDILQQQADSLKRERASLYQILSNMPQLQTWPTEANFILFRPRQQDASAVHARLLEKKILIKNLSTAHPLLSNCLRVTVGTVEENAVFVDALKEIIGAT